MKKMMIAALSALLMVACSQGPQKGYVISGTADGTVDGDTVYLCEMQGFFAMNPLDTTVVKDGAFRFEGDIEGAAMRFIVPMHEGMPTAMAMFVLENANIKATLVKDGEEGTKIEGGPSQLLYNEMEEGDKPYAEQLEQAWAAANDSAATDEARATAQQAVDSLQSAQKAYHLQFVKDHMPSAFSDMMLQFIFMELSTEEQEELLKLCGEKQPDYPVYKSIMAQREAEASTAVGADYTDLEQEGPDGKMVKVSDYVGKSKLVLNDVAVPADASENNDLNYFIGRTGTAHTALRPAGIGEFDGVKLNVVSDGEFISAGKGIRVESVSGNRIVVRETEAEK